jgi:hypothetical protein
MPFGSGKCYRLLISMVVLGLAGCTVEVPAPDPPQFSLPDASSQANTICSCTADELTQKVFRLTRLEIDEPQELSAVLNAMWAGEIQKNILNVLFRVDEAQEGATAAFDKIKMAAGPAWRSPKEPASLPPVGGDSVESRVDSYCMLDGLDIDLELKPYHGYQCQVKNPVAASLLFHLGPTDKPMMCAPLLDPPNATPLKDLKVRFGFSEDCTSIKDGFLEGCIQVEDAQRMCICMVAGNCEWTGDPTASENTDDLAGYCGAACGDNWVSFGTVVQLAGVKPGCLTIEGKQGYRLQAFFDAVDVSDRFNPVQSADCMEMR